MNQIVQFHQEASINTNDNNVRIPYPPHEPSPMMSVLLLLGCIISLLALIGMIHFLVTLHLPSEQGEGHVSLLLPLSGINLNLNALGVGLMEQTLRPRRLIISVESKLDPAYRQALDFANCQLLPVEVVVAGEAKTSAQKSWNHAVALELIDDQDDAVVLLDGDIQPRKEWLSHLVTPVLRGKFDVVTGYRWQIPIKLGLAVAMITSIDRVIALMPRFYKLKPPWGGVPWGGSIAISRSVLKRLDLQTMLAKTLSDDCGLGLQLREMGIKVLTRRALLVASPLDGDFTSCWGFGTRQYQMIRIYFPELWCFAFTVMLIKTAAWIVAFLTWGTFSGTLAFLCMVLCNLLALLLQSLVAKRLHLDGIANSKYQILYMAILKPITDIFHFGMIVSAFSREVQWSHVRYRVTSKYSVQILSRKPW